MIRGFDRLSKRRAQAARAFWYRSATRFRLRLYGLSGYPWATQRTPRLVFAVRVARWLMNCAAKERARSTERRSRQPRREPMRLQMATSHVAGRATRGTALRQTASVAKTLRISHRGASLRPAWPPAERRITARTTSRQMFAYRRVARSDRSIAFRHAIVAPRVVVKTRWLSRDRISREVEARFVERSARAVFVVSAMPRSVVANDARAWQSPRGAGHAVTQPARRRRELALPRRNDASRRRMAAIVRSPNRAHELTNRQLLNSFASLPKFRALRVHKNTSGSPIVRPRCSAPTGFSRMGYRLRRAGHSASLSFARRSERHSIAAVAGHTVRHAASSRRRTLIGRSVSSAREHTVVALARYESIAKPPMIVQRRSKLEATRAETTAKARQAQSAHYSHAGSWSNEERRSDNRSQRPPAIEEVRRILIPLLQETLFSERTMGRLANGVVSDIDRRDSVERYRKSGGR